MAYSNITINWEYHSDKIDKFVIYRSDKIEDFYVDQNIITELSPVSRSFKDEKINKLTNYFYGIATIFEDQIKYSEITHILSGDESGNIEWNLDTIKPLYDFDHRYGLDINDNYTVWTSNNVTFKFNGKHDYDDGLILNNVADDNGYSTIFEPIEQEQIWFFHVHEVLEYDINKVVPIGFALFNEDNSWTALSQHSYNFTKYIIGWNANVFNNDDQRFNLNEHKSKYIGYGYLDQNTGFEDMGLYSKFINYGRRRSSNTNTDIIKSSSYAKIGTNYDKVRYKRVIIGTGVLDKMTIDRIVGMLAWSNDYVDILPDNHPYKKYKPFPEIHDMDIIASEAYRVKLWQNELSKLSGVYDRIGGAVVAYPNDCHANTYACSKWSYIQSENIITATLDGYNTGAGGMSYYNTANNPISVIQLKLDDKVKDIDIFNYSFYDYIFTSKDHTNYITYDYNDVSNNDKNWTSVDKKFKLTQYDGGELQIEKTKFGINLLSGHGNIFDEDLESKKFTDVWFILVGYTNNNPNVDRVGFNGMKIKGNRYDFLMYKSYRPVGSFNYTIQVPKDENSVYDIHTPEITYTGDFILVLKYQQSNSSGLTKGITFNLYSEQQQIRFNENPFGNVYEYSGIEHFWLPIYDDAKKSHSIKHNSIGIGLLSSKEEEYLVGSLAHEYQLQKILPKDHPYKILPPLKDKQ